MDDAAIARSCELEIVELHRFFTDWFHGALPDTDEAWARVTGVLAPPFTMISPEGRLLPRADLLEGIRSGHGRHGEAQDFRIWIRSPRCRQLTESLVLATYEEWQRRDGVDVGRLSTALFERDADTPYGVRWLHVHETWLPTAT